MSTSRLRVVHVIDSLAGSGGAENRLVDEVIALDDRVDQTVVRLFERDFLEARLTAAGIPVVALGFLAGRAGRTWPLVARRLTAELRDLRPDVIHTSLFTGNLVGQLAGWRLGVPVVSTFNRTGELSLQRELQAGVASWKGRVMQSIGRRATGLGDVHYRAVGDYARETNCNSLGLPLDRATVVPRGVALASVAGGVSVDAVRTGDGVPDRGVFGVPGGVPLFANVARLVPEKAQHLLVEAFALVREQEPDARLAIAGAPGPAEAAVLDAIERTGTGEVVHLLGFRDDARDLVAAADVFAFSSISEGSPGAVVEAMALGAPVAAFAIPPVAELTEGDRFGWMAEPGSAEALAAAMLGALRDADRVDRAAAGRRHAAERYSLSAVARQLGDLLERRAGREPAHPDATATAGSITTTGTAGSAEPTPSAGTGDTAGGEAALDRGAFVISIDTEMAWGEAHRRDGSGGGHDFGSEREVIDGILAVLARHDIPATWAIVGHLFLDGCARGADGRAHPDAARPDYAWLDGDWFDIDPCSDVDAAPYWYGPDIVAAISGCPTPQEIASHSFSHVIVDDPACTPEVFASELAGSQAVAQASGLDPMRSFVYPRNSIAQIDRLADHGFRCYRGGRPTPAFAGEQGWRRRTLATLDKVQPLAGSAVVPAWHPGGVWNVPQTYLFAPATSGRRLPPAMWVRRPLARLRQAARHRSLFHLWFHPYNVTAAPERSLDALDRICAAAARLRDEGRLDVVTMGDLAARLDASRAAPTGG